MLKAYIIKYKGYGKQSCHSPFNKHLETFTSSHVIFRRRRQAKHFARLNVAKRMKYTGYRPISFKVIAVFSNFKHYTDNPNLWFTKAQMDFLMKNVYYK